MFAYSFKRLGARLLTAVNEMDEVDGPQSGGAGCGRFSFLTSADAVLSRH